MSLYLATLSIFFPAGERMFVHAVQRHKEDPKVKSDPRLYAACSAFVAQESIHGREHEYYNGQLAKQYPIVNTLSNIVEVVTQAVTNYLPKRFGLEATTALEHWTAIMAEYLLNNQQWFIGSAKDTRFALVWLWHACEESEHKAVAFDVYEHYYSHRSKFVNWIGRCFSLCIASLIFWALVPIFFMCLVISSGSLFNLREWAKLISYLWISPRGHFPLYGGMFGAITPAYCDYFRLDFHPWDQDNSHHLKQLGEFEAKLKKFLDEDEAKAAQTKQAPPLHQMS
jgi:predicted metal-dependent hydrolase